MSENSLEKRLFKVIGYMVTSARNLLEEPVTYGPFRVLDSASRLISVLEMEGLASPLLLSLREKIDDGKFSLIGDRVAFEAFLESMMDVLVAHMDADSQE